MTFVLVKLDGRDVLEVGSCEVLLLVALIELFDKLALEVAFVRF